MATTNQQTSPADDFGTFVSTIPIGYVPASAEDVRRMNRLLRTPPTNRISQQFLGNLLVIKTLAPEQSRDLLIYPSPMVVDFVERLKQSLTLAYYNK